MPYIYKYDQEIDMNKATRAKDVYVKYSELNHFFTECDAFKNVETLTVFIDRESNFEAPLVCKLIPTLEYIICRDRNHSAKQMFDNDRPKLTTVPDSECEVDEIYYRFFSRMLKQISHFMVCDFVL